MPTDVAGRVTELLHRSPFPVPPIGGGTGNGTTGSGREQRGSSLWPPATVITSLRSCVTTASEVLL